MKKTSAGLALLLLVAFCCFVLVGCGTASESESSLTVYSFSGENERFSLSNGVIVLTPDEEIFYGGNLTEKQESRSDVAAYSAAFYVLSGDEQKILLSYSVTDETGTGIEISDQTGRVAGDIVSRAQIDDWQTRLFFELKTTGLNGEQRQDQIQLTVTEVTENGDA